MKTIELPCYGIRVEIDEETGAGTITSDLREEYNPDTYDDDDAREVENWNNLVDAITSLILAHACAGIDISTLAYIEGIETAVQACEQYV